MYATRLKAVLVVLGLGVLVLLVSLFRLQVLQGSRYRREAERRLLRAPGFRPTIRGTIYDRRGRALARDVGASDVAVYFPFIEMDGRFVEGTARRRGISEAEFRLQVERMWPELASLAGVPPVELQRRKGVITRRVQEIRELVRRRHGRRILVREETARRRNGIPHSLVLDVDLKTIGAIRSRPEAFPGLVILPTKKRAYLYGSVAPHVIGRLEEVTRQELDGGINGAYPPGHLRRYLDGDLIGRAGVEQVCEALLRGERGLYQKGIEGDLFEDIPPVPGRDVHLTLDAALQMDVEAVLDSPPSLPQGTRVTGAAVVLDCRTGEVLALASAPRYDVNFFRADWSDLARDPARPLVHRAVAGQYPLGSAFKAVTATAALHEGVLTPETVLQCGGVLDPDHPDRFRCHVFLNYGYGHGPMKLRDAIKRSCNLFFYKAAMRLGTQDGTGRVDLRLARERLMAWADCLGLGRPARVGLPGEAGGNIEVGDPRNLAVGQGELLVTPLQAAQIYGLVATAGRMPPLRLIREVPPDASARKGLNLNPKHMAVLCDAFAAVVNEEGGTGYGKQRATLPTIRIAGKTATAQAGSGGDHAWFVGFAPAEDPRIAFSVIVEHGGHGGATAGPIAREIVRAAKAHGYLDDGPPTAASAPPPPAPSDRPPGPVG